MVNVDPRLMPSIVSEARALRSSTSASTASLRARDNTYTMAAMKKQPSSDNIQVMVRVRKFVQREIDRGAECLVEMPDDVTAIIHPPLDAEGRHKNLRSKDFRFDRVFWSHSGDGDDEIADEGHSNATKSASNPRAGSPPYADQETVYTTLGERLLDANFEGYNTCIFAYGQTGSGKSYTMMGPRDDWRQRGIIPRVCEDMFERIAEHTEANKTAYYEVDVTYFEIYNEKVYDLLITNGSRSPLEITTDPATRTAHVAKVRRERVKNFEDVERLFERGDKHRRTASTRMNDTSSRSHAIFTINLKGIAEVDGKMEKRESHMRLIDLAGSEKASATGATGLRLAEGAKINLSLSTLSRVTKTLAANATRKRGHEKVPYRDSVLTRLLESSLGGNSKTAMIACVGPCDYDETLSTLRWASETKAIRTHATQNQTSQSSAERDAEIAKLAAEVQRLQSSLVEGAVLSEQSIRDHERSVRDQEQRISEYQRQVNAVTKAMEEKALISDRKIVALQDENATLRAHLKLAIDALKNPLPPIPEPGDESALDPENEAEPAHDEAGDEAYFEGSEDDADAEVYRKLDDRADEMDSAMAQLLGDISLFRRKLGDDLDRFHFTPGAEGPPIGVKVM